jgi:predicted MFS family arabinose efflux permease
MAIATATRPASLRRGRVAVSSLFLVYGVILGSWTSRIPAIKQALRLSDGTLSLALLAFAAGAIIGMQAVGRLVDRYGSTRVMIPAALVDGAILIAPAAAPDLPLLVVSLLGFGAVHGTLNVAMNANAVEVQRAWGKPLISSFHAVYSIGGFLGAALGGLYARADLGPVATFSTVTAIAFAIVGFHAAARWAYVTPDTPTPAPPSTFISSNSPSPFPSPSLHRSVLFLGALAFCCLVGEGAAADWSAVYLRDNLHSSPGFAANAYAAFAIAMTVGRLLGDRITALAGPVRLVRGCGILASAGLATGLLINAPAAGVVGFGCLGAGLSCIVPQVFSTAGSRDPARAGQAIARVASLGFLGFIVGPILIGGAAELVGLPVALSIPVVLVLAVALAAPALRPDAQTTTSPAATSDAPPGPIDPASLAG